MWMCNNKKQRLSITDYTSSSSSSRRRRSLVVAWCSTGLLWLLLLLLLSLSSEISAVVGVDATRSSNSTNSATTPPTPITTTRPNIIVILLDDLDWTLGGGHASTLKKTRHWFSEGKMLQNWFVHTPVCCPSRAQLLTGKYFHNLRTVFDTTNTTTTSHDNDNNNKKNKIPQCFHVNVSGDDPHCPFYEQDYFAQHFAELHYQVGIFGKHLNSQNPTTFVPKGVDEWLVNNGGDYLDPTFTYWKKKKSFHDKKSQPQPPPQTVTFDNCTNTTGMPCYSTSVIGNASLDWMQRQLENHNNNPFLALISVKAPHIQDGDGFPMAIPAPWYENMTIEETPMAPRTPNYNQSCHDHHWLVRQQDHLTNGIAQKVDELYVSRLKTLQSVDDLVNDVFEYLTESHQINNTYVVFTSDNGYRLGQFCMPQCKLHAYENDIRVPFFIRGPGILFHAQDNNNKRIVGTHVDLMPTLLGFATHNASNDILSSTTTMDGSNLAGWFWSNDSDDDDDRDESNNTSGREKDPKNDVRQTTATTTTTTPARSSSSVVLLEYMSLGNVVRYQHLVDTYNHTFIGLRIILLPKKNLKYVEYRDSRQDWNATQPALEVELFDLDHDPWELHNLAASSKVNNPYLLEWLADLLQRLFHCQGDTCRREIQQAFSNNSNNNNNNTEFFASLLPPAPPLLLSNSTTTTSATKR